MTSQNGFRIRARLMIVTVFVVTLASVAFVGCGSSSGSSAVSESSSKAQPGACPTENTKTFAKTKFVLHSGLAFGAFHRYLYKPFKAGTFKKGADGRFRAFVKAGLAALFVKREVRLAAEDVQANPTLCKLIGKPLKRFSELVGGIVGKLKAGDVTAIGAAESALQSVTSLASGTGVDITEDENADLSG